MRQAFSLARFSDDSAYLFGFHKEFIQGNLLTGTNGKTVAIERKNYILPFMSRELIEQAINDLGTQAKLAEACGVKQSSIWQAKESGRCSAELAMSIEMATEGRITAHALRPDLPWPTPSHAEVGS